MGKLGFTFRPLDFAQDMVSGLDRHALQTMPNRKFKMRRHLGVLLVVTTLASAGCGYHFFGRGEQFPNDVRTVFVEPFVNRTREPTLEREFAAAFKSELHGKGQLKVVDRIDDADAVLSGVLRRLDSRVVGVNRHDEVLQYEMVLIVDMTLRRRSPDEVLWRTQGARFSNLYAGSRGAVVTTSSEFRAQSLNASDVRQFTDIQLTETMKQDSRGRLLESAAHDLHARLLEMF